MDNQDQLPEHQQDPKENKKQYEPSQHLAKQRQKTTTLALGILLAVSLTLIGFQAVEKRDRKQDGEDLSVKGSRSLLILSQEKEQEGPGLITTNRFGEPRENDGITLKEMNRLQTNKINALKRQLVEANQKLHEVKAHLFTKGDPADRTRLAEICQDVVEKERQNNELQDKVVELEKERELRLQKINRMEHTIDALATMTDTQRATKEQAILNFQDQIERLEETAQQEKMEFEKALQELEEARVALRESLKEKLGIIKNLEEEISWQYTVLHERDSEIQSQSHLFSTTQSQLNRKLKDLAALLEIEFLKNKNAQSELEVASARQAAQEQYSKSLENRFARLEESAQNDKDYADSKIHSLIHEYLDLQGLLDVYTHAHDHFSNKHHKLAQLVREEQHRTNVLQQQLDMAIATNDSEQQRGFCLEEELHETAQRMALLQQELTAQQALMTNKQQEFEAVLFAQGSLRDQLHEKINQLNTNLAHEQQTVQLKDSQLHDLTIKWELERTHAQELDHRLNELMIVYKDEKEKGATLEEHLSQKAEVLAAFEDRLQDKQHEINELKGQLNSLAVHYEQEKIRTNELHRALVTALNEGETDQSHIRSLRKSVEEHTDTLSLLQDRMESKKLTISDLQAQMDQFASQLEEERNKNLGLQQELAVVTVQKDSSEEIANALEKKIKMMEGDLRSQAQTIVSFEDALGDKQQEVRGILEQFHQVSRELEQEKGKTSVLLSEVETAHIRNENETMRLRTLESQLAENERQIRGLLDQLDQVAQENSIDHEVAQEMQDKNNRIDNLQKMLEVEKHRSSAMEKARLQENERAASLARKLDEYAEQLEDLKRKIGMSEQQLASSDRLESASEIASASVMTHSVTEGESLSSISTYYYGTPNRWIDIYNANRKVIPNKNHLRPGTKLVIPR